MNKIIFGPGIFLTCVIIAFWIAATAYGWQIDQEIKLATIAGFLGILVSFYYGIRNFIKKP